MKKCDRPGGSARRSSHAKRHTESYALWAKRKEDVANEQFTSLFSGDMTAPSP